MNQLDFALRNIADKLRKILIDWGTLKFYTETYLLSKFDHHIPDTYIVSYPKCGRTWLRIMLQKYLELGENEIIHYYDRALLGIKNQTIIKFEHGQGAWIPAPPRLNHLVFKTGKYTGKKVIFLVRDPRDVLVSSWYHLTYRERIVRMSLSEFIRDDLVGIRKVVAFMNMWINNKDIPADFLLITYEDIHADPAAVLEQVLMFMGFDVHRKNMLAAIDASRFDNMKEMEKQGALKEPWMKPGAKNQEKSMKVRKGKVGGFREELTNEDLAFIDQVICDELSPELPYHPQ